MIGFSSEIPLPNEDEVETTKWIEWKAWLQKTQEHPYDYSQWCVEETKLLEENQQFHKLLNEHLTQ
jgi:isopentenyldiphosphate isomerase